MNLEQALQQPEFNGLTDEQALDYGNESVVIGGTDELWSYSGVAITFGDEAAEGILSAIQSMLPGAAQVYLVKGMQLSLPAVQDKLTAIGLAFPQLADTCQGLKEIGISHGSRWQLWGLTTPTLEAITAARVGPTTQQRIATFCNTYWNLALADPNTTVADLQTLAADTAKWGI